MIKHPRGLPVLFMTEFWERFGFYIVQWLLILYLVNKFTFSDTKSYAILGAFTALAYIMPVIGGYLADRLLGFRIPIILGGLMLAAGYALLAFEQLPLLYIGLGCITVGNGLFKPNVSSLLGFLYNDNDPRRESGFTIFYCGINAGGLVANASSGFVQQHLGWSASFLAASVGLIIGVLTFVLFKSFLKNKGQSKIKLSLQKITIGICFLVTATALSILLLKYSEVAEYVLTASTVLLFVFLIKTSFTYQKKERRRMLGLLVLIFVSILFWAIFFQLFFSVNLFVQRSVDRHFFSYTLPPTLFISLENLFIIILGPFMAKLWLALKNSNNDVSVPTKFSLSLFFSSFGFFVLYASTAVDQGLISPFWVVFAYLFATLGELLISPIGLSMITEYSPKKLTGLMMGVWFFSLGMGGELAGMIAKYSAIPKDMTKITLISHFYGQAFLVYSAAAILIGILLFIGRPIVSAALNKPTLA